MDMRINVGDAQEVVTTPEAGWLRSHGYITGLGGGVFDIVEPHSWNTVSTALEKRRRAKRTEK